MATIGVHASHEQHAPSELRQLMRRAELLGFSSGMCSDHFHPWSERQGQSGFAWSWLGAALEATSMDLGVVCAPGQRYHPAIIAQASATLAEMFPERFWLAVGSGEALNESITGDQWPPKADRNARLREAADIIRALWRGETVNHRGLITVHEATLFTRPQKPPPLIGAALTEETARWLGSWADGLITAGAAHDGLKRIVEAFREGGGEGKPLFLQTAVSFGDFVVLDLLGGAYQSRVQRDARLLFLDEFVAFHHESLHSRAAEQSRTTFRHVAGRFSAILYPPDEFIKLPPDEVLERTYQAADQLGLPLRGHVTRWRIVNHPFDFYAMRPGTEAMRPEQRTPVPGLSLAGDYTKQSFTATMEGAVISGRLAAESIVNG